MALYRVYSDDECPWCECGSYFTTLAVFETEEEAEEYRDRMIRFNGLNEWSSCSIDIEKIEL